MTNISAYSGSPEQQLTDSPDGGEFLARNMSERSRARVVLAAGLLALVTLATVVADGVATFHGHGVVNIDPALTDRITGGSEVTGIIVKGAR